MEKVNEDREIYLDDVKPQTKSLYHRLTSWRWVPSSADILEESERKLLIGIKSQKTFYSVPVLEGRCQLWSACFQSENLNDSEKIPLVLIHGLGGALGVFFQNFDALCQNRTVYAIDLLGFGRSSRHKLNKDPILAESEYVQSIEDFRKEMKLNKMILLGHSFGGYLSSAYALEYPDRIRHLILLDPWGFPQNVLRPIQLPYWFNPVARILTANNLLSGLRAAGPWGPKLVRRFRRRRAGTVDDGAALFDYFYHCNVQTPSGEEAFQSMARDIIHPKRPMIDRLPQLKEDVPITFIYGSQTFLDNSPAYKIQQNLRTKSYVKIEIVEGAGHNVFADKMDVFNHLIYQIGSVIDSNKDLRHFCTN